MRKLFIIGALLLFCGCAPQPESDNQKMIRIIHEACDVFDFPVDWTMAIMWSEHSGIKNENQKCSHHRIAYGPGGILYRTAKEDLGFEGKESELNNYEVSIPLCVSYMAKLYKAYGKMDYTVNHYQCGKKHNNKYFLKVQKIVFAGCCP
jgi:hypothetical protein